MRWTLPLAEFALRYAGEWGAAGHREGVAGPVQDLVDGSRGKQKRGAYHDPAKWNSGCKDGPQAGPWAWN